MKIMVCGGTGFLGYYTVLDALKKGHECASMSIDDVSLEGWYPKEVKTNIINTFTASEDELVPLMEGYDAFIYSVGPDDRVTPKAPSYDFFHQHLVTDASKVFRAAERAGIKRSVVYNSYFAYFDRAHPEKKLAAYHPYIRARVEQAEALIGQAKNMDVMVLELPYIFGCMPNRTPIWRDVFIERFFKGKMVFFPKGGTTMIHVKHIGEAGVGALEYGKHGERYPIGDENHNYKYMLECMQEGLNVKKKIVQVNRRLCAIGANMIEKKDAKQGLQPGLNMKHLMLDIMGDELYIPDEVNDEMSKTLHFGRGGVKEGIIEAMKACYPNGFGK
ncbi:MAG: NAD(P)H-binding protein [Clostridia bacterium]|nr:NAD(P)H-binding protein [Clostridia bacterium]